MNKREETYHMTEKEMVRLKVAERLIDGHMKIDQAAVKQFGILTKKFRKHRISLSFKENVEF